MNSAENDPGGQRYADLLPAEIHPSLRPSIHTRLAFANPLYLRSTSFAAVLYALQHALWTAPNMPWTPTKMPIKWDPSDQEVPCALLGLYHSVLSHGGFEAVEAADLWQLVAEQVGRRTRKAIPKVVIQAGGRTQKLSAKECRGAYVRYLLLFEIWARGVRVMLGHRRTWIDALLPGNTISTDAKDFVVTTWGWPDEPWPIERAQTVVEDRGWELFSESMNMLNLTWNELAIESSQIFTDPDPSGPDDLAQRWNERDPSCGGSSSVPGAGLGVPPVRVDELDPGELKDTVQDWIEWENRHIPGAPLFVPNSWVFYIRFVIDEVRNAPLEEYERLRRLPGPPKKPPTPPSSQGYSDEGLQKVMEASPWKGNIDVQQAELVEKYGLQDHQLRLTKAFRNSEESLYDSGHVVGGWSELVGRYGFRYHKRKAAVHPCKHKGRAQLRRNRFLSYMCSSYRLSTVYEEPNDPSCGPLTFGEYYKIYGHSSPVILNFLQERLEKEGRFKKWEFEEVERCQGSCMAFPKVPDAASSALNKGLLPGPSSQVDRVQRSLPGTSLRVRRSASMSEMPSPKFQEYQCSDGSTFSGRLPPGIFQNHQPGEVLNVQKIPLSRSWRLAGSTSLPHLASPEVQLSSGSAFNWRLPPGQFPNHRPGEVSHVQGRDHRGYLPLPGRILSGGTAVGERPTPRPVPSHQARDARMGIPSSSLRLRRSTAIPQETFLEYQLSDGSTFSGRLPPGLFPNLQPGELVDIQNGLRHDSISLPSRGVREHDLSDGRASGGYP